MSPRIACGLTAVTLLFAAPLAAQSESPDSLALGRKFTGWFFDGHSDSLWNVMGEATRGRVGGIENIENMMDQVLDQIGEEVEVVSESAKARDDSVRLSAWVSDPRVRHHRKIESDMSATESMVARELAPRLGWYTLRHRLRPQIGNDLPDGVIRQDSPEGRHPLRPARLDRSKHGAIGPAEAPATVDQAGPDKS